MNPTEHSLARGGSKDAEREYYTVAEAARVLRVSAATIWRWIEAGRLPAYRVGPKNIRVRKGDLQSMIEPARAKEEGTGMGKERRGIWADYDPERVKAAVARAAGSWADVDAEALIAELYRGREEGSRPESRL